MWWGRPHDEAGASITYDVTEQLYQPQCRTASTVSPAARTVRPIRLRSTSRSRWFRKPGLMYPKATVLQRLLPGRLARARHPHLEPRLALRRRAHRRHPRLAGRHRRQQLRPARRLHLGSARRPEVGGPRRLGRFTQQHPIFTIVKGGVLRPQRPGDAVAGARPTRVPDLSQRAARLPAGRDAAGPQHPGDLARPRERVRLGRNVAVQRQIGPRTSVEIAAT